MQEFRPKAGMLGKSAFYFQVPFRYPLFLTIPTFLAFSPFFRPFLTLFYVFFVFSPFRHFGLRTLDQRPLIPPQLPVLPILTFFDPRFLQNSRKAKKTRGLLEGFHRKSLFSVFCTFSENHTPAGLNFRPFSGFRDHFSGQEARILHKTHMDLAGNGQSDPFDPFGTPLGPLWGPLWDPPRGCLGGSRRVSRRVSRRCPGGSWEGVQEGLQGSSKDPWRLPSQG